MTALKIQPALAWLSLSAIPHAAGTLPKHVVVLIAYLSIRPVEMRFTDQMLQRPQPPRPQVPPMLARQPQIRLQQATGTTSRGATATVRTTGRYDTYRTTQL